MWWKGSLNVRLTLLVYKTGWMLADGRVSVDLNFSTLSLRMQKKLIAGVGKRAVGWLDIACSI